MNSKYKNIIIAAMTAGIFYMNILETIPNTKAMAGVIYIFFGSAAAMELFDNIEVLRYGTRTFMTPFRFNRYKNWLGKKVEKLRVKGKDEAFLKKHIIDFIGHDKRFAYTGAQILELVSLATNTETTVCAQCGQEGVKKDMLKTIEGYTCEDCIKE